jgi:hypothetical protein
MIEIDSTLVEHGGNFDFQAASQIHYLKIGISTVNLIDLSDFNHALRMMSDAGAQVRQICGVLLSR